LSRDERVERGWFVHWQCLFRPTAGTLPRAPGAEGDGAPEGGEPGFQEAHGQRTPTVGYGAVTGIVWLSCEGLGLPLSVSPDVPVDVAHEVSGAVPTPIVVGCPGMGQNSICSFLARVQGPPGRKAGEVPQIVQCGVPDPRCVIDSGGRVDEVLPGPLAGRDGQLNRVVGKILED
jgi:hypothetical protein